VVEDAATAIALRRNMVNFFAVRSEGGGAFVHATMARCDLRTLPTSAPLEKTCQSNWSNLKSRATLASSL
jgi:hypothetical protein